MIPTDLPLLSFQGEIIVVQDSQKAEEYLRNLQTVPRLGFDTESKPAFVRGIAHPISLVQLATEERAFLFQLRKTGFPDAMIQLFMNPFVEKVGLDIDMDIKKLRELRNFTPRSFVDLSKFAKKMGMVQIGLKSLTQYFLGARLSKRMRTSDWSRDRLSAIQKLYAATDAWVCLRLYPFLMKPEPFMTSKKEY